MAEANYVSLARAGAHFLRKNPLVPVMEDWRTAPPAQHPTSADREALPRASSVAAASAIAAAVTAAPAAAAVGRRTVFETARDLSHLVPDG
ncbi:MAG: hypothetical protein V3T80_07185, partial [Kiloniellales bacterium]